MISVMFLPPVIASMILVSERKKEPMVWSSEIEAFSVSSSSQLEGNEMLHCPPTEKVPAFLL